MATYRSAVDGWFIGVAALAGAIGGVATVAAAAAGLVLPAVISFGALGIVLWIWASTRYTITDTALVVRSAFVRASVPLDSIASIRPTQSVLSAPALSVDRLVVEHTDGALVISPRERDRFLREIVERAPAVRVHPLDEPGAARVVRRRRYLWLALLPGLAALAVLSAVGFRAGPPAAVRVTDAGITLESRGAFGPGTIEIPAGDVVSVELADSLPPGLRRRFGLGSPAALRGRFSLGDQSGYVHVARPQPPYVVVRARDRFVIVNLDDAARTRALYDEMATRWPGP